MILGTGDQIEQGDEAVTNEVLSEVSSASVGGSSRTSLRGSVHGTPDGSPVSTPELLRVGAVDFPHASYSSSDDESYYDASEHSSPNGRRLDPRSDALFSLRQN